MFTRVLALAIALIVLACGIASAQIPFIAVYFDPAYQVEGLAPPPCANSCPGIGVPGELWIALVNANKFVTGVEFMVEYPIQIQWLADVDVQPVTVGTTPTGFSMGYPLPQNGFEAVDICRVLFLWQCDRCEVADIEIVVLPNPSTGFLGFTDFPNFIRYPAAGLTSLICACVPAQETSWGKVKALYAE
jgi:hypothetical protein